MYARLATGLTTLALALNTRAQDGCPTEQTCLSYGVDIVSGGSYFQNSLSTDSFTAVQEFEGCQNDTSHNVLVDPAGDQYECSLTPMTPDDVVEMVTCPIQENQLYTGDWSLLALSNNGQCQAIAYQRDFHLSVGPQQTITVEPTLTISNTYTPVQSSTITRTQTITSTARASTKTVPQFNFDPTITIYPLPSITFVTKAILTVTSTLQDANVVATTTAQTTAICVVPSRRQVQDPLANILATVLADLGLETGVGARDVSAEPTGRSASNEYRRAIVEGRVLDLKLKAQFLVERSQKLALNKRTPDESTITVTDATAVPATTTVSFTAATSTITGTTTIISTVTTTPTVTVSKGLAFSIAHVTASRKTLTNTFFVPVTTAHVTHVTGVTLTITSTVTPAGASARCDRKGGTLT